MEEKTQSFMMGPRWKFVTVHRQEFSGQKILHGPGAAEAGQKLRERKRIERNNFLLFQIIYAKIRTTESKIAAIRVLHSR